MRKQSIFNDSRKTPAQYLKNGINIDFLKLLLCFCIDRNYGCDDRCVSCIYDLGIDSGVTFEVESGRDGLAI